MSVMPQFPFAPQEEKESLGALQSNLVSPSNGIRTVLAMRSSCEPPSEPHHLLGIRRIPQRPPILTSLPEERCSPHPLKITSAAGVAILNIPETHSPHPGLRYSSAVWGNSDHFTILETSFSFSGSLVTANIHCRTATVGARSVQSAL